MALAAASLAARTRSSTTSPRGGPGLLPAGSGGTPTPRQGRSASRQPRRPATGCRRYGRHALVGDPPGPRSTNPSPCGPGDGVGPVQRRPAAAPASRRRRGPLLLGRCGACPPPWLATAAPAPPPTAPRRAPDTAGRRGCRTAARSCGTPGSANRRSPGCTDRSRRASANRYRCGPCRTPSRAGWRLPRAGGSSGRSPGVTALGLVARLRPTHQAGGHGQVGAASRLHRTPRRSGSPGTVWVRPATQSRNGHRTRHPGALDRPVMSRPARVGLTRSATGSWIVRWGP
jgi:hypothetical protein